MRGFNRVFIAGYLGGDPELLWSRGGSPYARLRVATNRSWFNGDGKRAGAEPEERAADWHRVFVWGRQAQICAQQLRKGNALAVEGHLSTYRSPAAEAQEDGVPPPDGRAPALGQLRTSIIADRVHFLPRSIKDAALATIARDDSAPASDGASAGRPEGSASPAGAASGNEEPSRPREASPGPLDKNGGATKSY